MKAPTFTQNLFTSSNPRLAPHLLSEGICHRAVDVRFERGMLQPFRDSLKVHDLQANTATVHQIDCCWVEFPTCVTVADGSATCGEFYVVGTTAGFPLRYVLDDNCNVTASRLGLPCPITPPQFTVSTVTPNKDSEDRTYCYAYKNSRGELSQMSPALEPKLINDGDTAVVSGWEIPPAEWDVTEVEIYRTVSGALSGQATGAVKLNVNEPDTFWMYVGDAGINDASFTDTRLNEELTRSREFELLPPPPADLEGIGVVDSMNVLFGWRGKEFFFSKNNSFHAWPHRLTLDDNIKAVVEAAGFIYVATDGHPYVLNKPSDCSSAGCVKILRASESAPMEGCGIRRMAAVGSGAVWAGKGGLYRMGADGHVKLITLDVRSEEQWGRMLPDHVTPVYYDGRLYVFGYNDAFVMTLRGETSDLWSFDGHADLSDRVEDAFVSRQNQFFLVKSNGIDRWVELWEGATTYRSYHFESKEIRSAFPVSYQQVFVGVEGGGMSTIKVVGDRVSFYENPVMRTEALPPITLNAYARNWHVEIDGSAFVVGFSLSADRLGLRA